MVRIRLSRTGAKKQPSYRVVVADSESKRDGRVVERIGFYSPRTEPEEFRIDEGRALYWLSVGAQPSDAVKRLLVQQGTFDRLARLRKGENRDRLVAEFSGVAEAVIDEPADIDEEDSSTEELHDEISSANVVSEEEE